MRTSLITSLSVALFVGVAGAIYAGPATSANSVDVNTGTPNQISYNKDYTMYSAIPRTPGIKTLIDFNDYATIINSVKGYVIVRYLPDNGTSGAIQGVGADAQALAEQVGSTSGMPVTGWSSDPDKGSDKHKMRDLTRVGAIFVDSDPSRAGDAYSQSLSRGVTAGGGTTTAATTTTAGGTAGGYDYASLPKDKFGGVVYTIDKSDMALDNWVVELNSSANTIPNRRVSYTKEVWSFPASTTTAPTAGGAAATGVTSNRYLGIRVRFPDHRHNAHARIAPQYQLPAFDARGFPINYGLFDPQAKDAKGATNKEPFGAAGAPATAAGGTATAGAVTTPNHEDVVALTKAIEDVSDANHSNISYNGVLHNISDIKEIVVRVAGRNYNNGFAIRLRDENSEVSEYFVGYLDFTGWRTLRWTNPTYLPAELMEPFRLPLYPTEIPYVAFDSFVIYRDGGEIGGDFVTYVDWVKLDYDLAVPPAQLEIGIPEFIDVDDDSWWYALRDRNAARTADLMERFSEQIDLRRQQLGRTVRHADNLAPREGEAPIRR